MAVPTRELVQPFPLTLDVAFVELAVIPVAEPRRSPPVREGLDRTGELAVLPVAEAR